MRGANIHPLPKLWRGAGVDILKLKCPAGFLKAITPGSVRAGYEDPACCAGGRAKFLRRVKAKVSDGGSSGLAGFSRTRKIGKNLHPDAARRRVKSRFARTGSCAYGRRRAGQAWPKRENGRFATGPLLGSCISVLKSWLAQGARSPPEGKPFASGD